MNKSELKLFLILLLFFATTTFFRNQYFYTTLVDDAFIFFRFAENLVSGYGFVWNINEPPVEGYSSFLYLVILLIPKLISIDIEFFAITINVLFTALTLYLTFKLYKLIDHHNLSDHKPIYFAIIILSISPNYHYWAAAGMDTPFYSMFLVLTIYLFLKLPNNLQGSFIKGLSFGFLSMIRFEALPLFVVTFLYFLHKLRIVGTKDRNKNIFTFFLGFSLTFGIYFIWRWNYFGYFLPNTYYAKTGGGWEQIKYGFIYISYSMKKFYSYMWILIIILSIGFVKWKFLTKEKLFLLVLSAVSLISTIFIGGDYFPHSRFIVPIFPFFMCFLTNLIDNLIKTNYKFFFRKSKFIVIIFSIIFTYLILTSNIYLETIIGIKNFIKGKKELVTTFDRNLNDYYIEWHHGWILMGKKLNEFSTHSDYIAVVPIGAIGYYSKIKILDMIGIVDPNLAHKSISRSSLLNWNPGHSRGDGKYILSRKPKYIQLTNVITRKPHKEPPFLGYLSIKEIWESDDFHNNYIFYPIKILDGWYYNLFIRKEYLKKCDSFDEDSNNH